MGIIAFCIGIIMLSTLGAIIISIFVEWFVCTDSIILKIIAVLILGIIAIGLIATGLYSGIG